MNEQEFSQKNRQILTILIVIFGLFVVFVAPFLIQGSLDAVIARVAPKISEENDFHLTVIFLPTWFFIMRAITFVAGVTLVVIALPFYRGEKWTWPVTLSAVSLPTMFGVLFSLPHLVQYGRPPAAGFILLFGLVVFLLVLLLREGSKTEKWARFFTFTMLGVTAGHINVLVMHAIKNIIVRPDYPYFSDPMYTVYTYEGPISFVAVIFCIVAIPLLATEKHKMTGWYMALIAGIVVTLVNYPTHFIRMQTSDYFVAGSLGLGLTIVTLIPAFRKALLGED